MTKNDRSHLVFDFREQSTGPVKEVLSKSHFVVVVFVAPFAHRSVRPFLKPFILHHRQYGHARFSCERETHKTSHLICVDTQDVILFWYDVLVAVHL